jgi:DNA-binding transcriptional ArsR family regulator
MKEEAKLFKILADPTRLKLAVILSILGETCVCELAGALNEPQYKISRHLGVMRSGKLVKARRKGNWFFYKLEKPKTVLEKCLQECFCDCLADQREIVAALKRIKKVLSEKEKA